VSDLINKGLDLQMLRLHVDRLADLALTPPEPRDPAASLGPRRIGPAGIEVRGLRFRYSENDPWVLNGVDLRVEAGESVAIVGSSGCGKTTLLKLLASLLQPSQGEILIDGTPLPRLGTERYRAMIGVVMQDDQLFAGSIADNICFFAEQPNLRLIEECARRAVIHDDIESMSMGYGTLIGDMGTVLSGGQKQRVLIARALYREPGILLFDEATSHLDVGRELEVSTAIRSSRMTRILVAHRPETILSADRVLVMSQGRIVNEQVSSAGRELWIAETPRVLAGPAC
jgi:ATP-binding cassette subfamily B protein RaxB